MCSSLQSAATWSATLTPLVILTSTSAPVYVEFATHQTQTQFKMEKESSSFSKGLWNLAKFSNCKCTQS